MGLFVRATFVFVVKLAVVKLLLVVIIRVVIVATPLLDGTALYYLLPRDHAILYIFLLFARTMLVVLLLVLLFNN